MPTFPQYRNIKGTKTLPQETNTGAGDQTNNLPAISDLNSRNLAFLTWYWVVIFDSFVKTKGYKKLLLNSPKDDGMDRTIQKGTKPTAKCRFIAFGIAFIQIKVKWPMSTHKRLDTIQNAQSCEV
ncbi:hypothetical protein NQ317_009469 [Molorchus minor]|uniref:Uncharacterized protein n=1 Tax=Molorchus minor TaxID=1323400 RepID=A0ABQ9IQJ0_9CUCU|nr:hypothetical protein NQ317_009469 [Molorchus minor]